MQIAETDRGSLALPRQNQNWKKQMLTGKLESIQHLERDPVSVCVLDNTEGTPTAPSCAEPIPGWCRGTYVGRKRRISFGTKKQGGFATHGGVEDSRITECGGALDAFEYIRLLDSLNPRPAGPHENRFSEISEFTNFLFQVRSTHLSDVLVLLYPFMFTLLERRYLCLLRPNNDAHRK